MTTPPNAPPSDARLAELVEHQRECANDHPRVAKVQAARRDLIAALEELQARRARDQRPALSSGMRPDDEPRTAAKPLTNARLADILADRVACEWPDIHAAMTECQARRAADATREAAPVLKRQLSGFGWEARVDGERMVLIKADAANLLHERYGVLAGSLDMIAKGATDPVEVAKAGLKASDEIRASMSEPAPGVVEALRRLCKVLHSHRLPAEHEALNAAVDALAAHDARQPQRDPMQAVLAEVAALVAPFAPPLPTGLGMKVPRDGAWPAARKELLNHIADAVLQVVEKDTSEEHNNMADHLERNTREVKGG